MDVLADGVNPGLDERAIVDLLRSEAEKKDIAVGPVVVVRQQIK